VTSVAESSDDGEVGRRIRVRGVGRRDAGGNGCGGGVGGRVWDSWIRSNGAAGWAASLQLGVRNVEGGNLLGDQPGHAFGLKVIGELNGKLLRLVGGNGGGGGSEDDADAGVQGDR